MKRNIELIRLILLNQEEVSENNPGISEKYSDDLRKFSNEERVYNTYLLINGKFLDGECMYQFGQVASCCINNITWKGQELLTVLRNKASFEALKKGLNNGMTIV